MRLNAAQEHVTYRPQMTKFCKKCNTEKPVSAFSIKRSRGKAGFHPCCKECRSKERKAHRAIPANREKILETTRVWRKRNPEKTKQHDRNYQAKHGLRLRVEAREHYAANSESLNASRRNKRYGITQEVFDAMLCQQFGKCLICEVTLSGETKNTTPHVDHCHSTKKNRGILCSPCNLMLGNSKDSPAILRRAAEYLEKSCAERTVLLKQESR